MARKIGGNSNAGHKAGNNPFAKYLIFGNGRKGESLKGKLRLSEINGFLCFINESGVPTNDEDSWRNYKTVTREGEIGVEGEEKSYSFYEFLRNQIEEGMERGNGYVGFPNPINGIMKLEKFVELPREKIEKNLKHWRFEKKEITDILSLIGYNPSE